IVILMSIYYFIMFAVFQTDEEKEADKKRSDKFNTWLGETLEERKKKKDKDKEDKDEKRRADKESNKKKSKLEKRKKLLDPAKGFLINAHNSAEKLRDDELKVKTSNALSDATRQVNAIKTNLVAAKKLFRVIRHREKPKDREYVQKLYDYNEYLIRESVSLERNIPDDPSDSNWDSKVSDVRTHANNIVGGCGYLINSIDKFIVNNKREIMSPPGSGGAGGSTGSPRRSRRPSRPGGSI
ncbi:hypothetical protein HN818_05795, partial [archaeon]|nr:hypothetical protein [archaeon]